MTKQGSRPMSLLREEHFDRFWTAHIKRNYTCFQMLKNPSPKQLLFKCSTTTEMTYVNYKTSRKKRRCSIFIIILSFSLQFVSLVFLGYLLKKNYHCGNATVQQYIYCICIEIPIILALFSF